MNRNIREDIQSLFEKLDVSDAPIKEETPDFNYRSVINGLMKIEREYSIKSLNNLSSWALLNLKKNVIEQYEIKSCLFVLCEHSLSPFIFAWFFKKVKVSVKIDFGSQIQKRGNFYKMVKRIQNDYHIFKNVTFVEYYTNIPEKWDLIYDFRNSNIVNQEVVRQLNHVLSIDAKYLICNYYIYDYEQIRKFENESSFLFDCLVLISCKVEMIRFNDSSTYFVFVDKIEETKNRVRELESSVETIEKDKNLDDIVLSECGHRSYFNCMNQHFWGTINEDYSHHQCTFYTDFEGCSEFIMACIKYLCIKEDTKCAIVTKLLKPEILAIAHLFSNSVIVPLPEVHNEFVSKCEKHYAFLKEEGVYNLKPKIGDLFFLKEADIIFHFVYCDEESFDISTRNDQILVTNIKREECSGSSVLIRVGEMLHNNAQSDHHKWFSLTRS